MNSFKFLAFFLIIILAFASCTEDEIVDSTSIGVWLLVDLTVNGTVVDETPTETTTSTFEETGSNISYLLQILEDETFDATGTYTVNGTSTADNGTTNEYTFEDVNFFLGNGTYAVDGDQITFSEAGLQPIIFTFDFPDDNTLTLIGSEQEVLTIGTTTTTTTRTYNCEFSRQ